jgi:hypothetical protein
METAEYQRFTEELRQRLEADERVVGLVALGSMAGRDYTPDDWRDRGPAASGGLGGRRLWGTRP